MLLGEFKRVYQIVNETATVLQRIGDIEYMVDNEKHPGYFSAFYEGKKIGFLSTRGVVTRDGKQYLSISLVQVEPKWRKRRIATNLYILATQAAKKAGLAGLYSYNPDVASRGPKKIRRRLGAKELDGDSYVFENSQSLPRFSLMKEAAGVRLDPKKIPDYVFYRGEHGDEDWTSYDATYAFTDSKEIAKVYAVEPSNRTLKAKRPRVHMVKLDIKNPLELNPDENVVTKKHLQDAFGSYIKDPLFQGIVRDMDWRPYEEAPDTVDSFDDLTDELYTDTNAIVGHKNFLPLAKKMGYDGVIFRDSFLADDLMDPDDFEIAVKDTSYDPSESSMIEIRPFSKDQVEILNTVYYKPMETGK